MIERKGRRVVVVLGEADPEQIPFIASFCFAEWRENPSQSLRSIILAKVEKLRFGKKTLQAVYAEVVRIAAPFPEEVSTGGNLAAAPLVGRVPGTS